MRVSSAGGQAEALTRLNEGEGSHRWPAIVPGTRNVLFAVEAGQNWDAAQIAIQSLDAPPAHRTLQDLGTSPRYLPTGHLVVARAGSLFAAPFDASRGVTTGPSRLILMNIASTFLGGNALFDVSRNGTMVYAPGGQENVQRTLVWVDRTGTAEPIPGAARGFETPRVSPDGERAAVTIREGDADIWVVGLQRGTLTRITSETGEDHSPAWTPDGARVVYSATRAGRSHVMTKEAGGAGSATELFDWDQHAHIGGWTPDGRMLWIDGGRSSEVFFVNVIERARPRAFVEGPFNQENPRPSPDGRWIAYRSDESGRFEVYVQPFAGQGQRTAISSDGGSEPVWARSGRELFYRNGDKMMAVDIDPATPLRAGAPRVLFESTLDHILWGEPDFDVSADGRRFLMIRSQPAAPAVELRLVTNWFADVRGETVSKP